jgi:phosphate uptake regulator
MVALPKKWVREMGLTQGSEIMITRASLTSLLITADVVAPLNGKQEAIIEVTEKDTQDGLFRKIVSLYVLGYSQVTIRSGNGYLGSTRRDGLKDLVRRHLIGTEGVADAKDKITIHVLLGYSELSVDNALKKMLMITNSMQEDAMTAIENHDKFLAEGVIQRDDEVGRFGLYVIRQLNMSLSAGVVKDSNLEQRDLLGYTLVARTLVRIAYLAANISREVVKLNEPLHKSIVAKMVPMGKHAAMLVEEAMLSLFKRDHLGADSVIENAGRFVELEIDLMMFLEKDVQTYYTIHLVLESQKRIAEYARDIAQNVLELTVERILRKEESLAVRVS